LITLGVHTLLKGNVITSLGILLHPASFTGTYCCTGYQPNPRPSPGSVVPANQCPCSSAYHSTDSRSSYDIVCASRIDIAAQ
jgi:hypothetical protein